MMDALLDRFDASLPTADADSLSHLREFFQWRTAHHDFQPPPTLSSSDDVDVRSYLLHLQSSGISRQAIRRQLRALKRFYAWAQALGLIETSPFDDFNLDRPLLSRDQIRRRQEALVSHPHEREIARLRALNRLAEHLNRSPDLRSTLSGALGTVVEVMGLRTAWAFVLTESGFDTLITSAPHDFALAAACALPPGLEHTDRYYLTCSPDCHCQSLLRSGRLTRAVNVVECTRLQDSAEANGDNAGLLFHATVPISVQGKPVGLINVAADEWQFLSAADLQLLSAVGAQLGVALERAQLYELAQTQRLRLEQELEMARAVQASLLPGILPVIPGYGLAADWRAAREVAGDFYDVFPLPEGRWGIVIADVSDKGAPAALYMVMARSLMRAQAEHTPGPATVLMSVHQALRLQCSAEMFVTVFYAVLDPVAHTLTYANAGHNPPLVRRVDGRLELLPKTGPLLGILDVEAMRLTERSLQLEPGEALVAYTDGLTDAENARREFYGLTRLQAAFTNAAATAQATLNHLLADLADFTGFAPQSDDMTILVMTREI